MVSISTVSNTTQTGVASTSTQATSTTVAKTTTTATATPTISTTNSSTVKVSAAALTVAKAAVATPPTVAKAISDYQAAKTAGTLDAFVPVSIKDAAAAFTDSADNRAVIREMVAAGKITGIAFTDTKPPTFTFDRSVLSGDLTSTANQSPAQILQKITTKYTLAITNVTAADALTIKPPVANATLALSVADTSDSVTGNITALQTLAKAKTLTNVTFTAATPKPSLTITAAQLKASPELLATIKGDYDFIITGVAAAEAVTVAGNADKVLKSSGSGSTQAKVAITDTSANLVKNIAALELAATAGRLTSITVSDGKALVLTEAQIKADSHFLATTFTSNATVEATAVAAADVLIVQSLVNANSKLTLTKESIADTAANIQANLDSLETAVKAPVASSASNAFTIANIGITDKGSITVTNSTLVKDIDALKVLTGKYTLNVTDISVSDALALKAPSKDATLAISVKDTAANVAANWDKLQAAAKAKTLTSIIVTDSASSLLSMTAPQLKADADALKLVTGDYKLSVIGVAAADVTKTLTTKNIYSVEVKDTAANILKNLTSIQTAVTAAKIQNVVITDAANPSLSISDIFALTTTLPNVTLAAGVKFNVKDTASTIIAHARDDIGDVLKNAGTVTIIDKTTPNLTLADAITLKGIANLAAGTKYNVTDGGSVIATQAAITGETVLSGAASVTINKNFTISDVKAVTGIKTLAKGTVYSITDTADNILAQSAIAGDKILSGANTVTVVDTSANIIVKLDQLEVLAKAGKIADIKFTDTPTAALNITNEQLVKDAEAIGKIISQRTLPALTITKPATPKPLLPLTTAPATFEFNLPSGGTAPIIKGLSEFNNKMWGYYTNATGISHVFYSNTDATGFADISNLLPSGATNFDVRGFNNDGTQLWGFLTNKDGVRQAFLVYPPSQGQAYNSDFSIFSNDGSKLAGISSDPALNKQIMIINNDGSNFKLVSVPNIISLNGFSPDGSTLLGQYRGIDSFSHVFAIKSDGTGFKDLSPPAPVNPALGEYNGGFNSEGNYFWGTYSNPQNSIKSFILGVDGNNYSDLTPLNMTTVKFYGLHPTSPYGLGLYKSDDGKEHLIATSYDNKDYIEYKTPNGETIYFEGLSKDQRQIRGYYYPSSGQKVWSNQHACTINLDGTGFADLNPNIASYTNTNGGSGTLYGNLLFGVYGTLDGKNHAFSVNSDGSGFIDLTPNAINAQYDAQTPSRTFASGTYQTPDQKWHGFSIDLTKSNPIPTTVPPPSVNTNIIPSVTNNNKPTFTGTAVGNSTITLYNNGSNLPWATVQSDAGGNWSYTPSNPISDGNYSITAKTSNTSGIQSAASPAVIFRVDTIPPSAPTLAGSTGTTNNNKPTLSGTAEANSTITFFNGSTQIGTTTTNSSGTWSYSPTSGLPDGSYNITAKATDAAGNTSNSSSALIFKIDTIPPSAPILTGPTGTIGNNKPVISGTAEANSVITLYNENTQIGTTITNLNGIWIYTPTSNLSDGSYSVTAKANDTAGNISLASNIASFKINTKDIAFALPNNYLVSGNARNIVSADIDGDGNLDLILPSANKDNISILKGISNGGFQNVENISVGHQPYEVIVNDFNGDGKQDIAISDRQSSDIAVLLNTGNLTFSTKYYSTLSYSPNHLYINDYNKDGIKDIYLSYDYSPGLKGSILLGNPDGTFGNRIDNIDFPSYKFDLNNDGIDDKIDGPNFSIYTGNANGTFDLRQTLSLSYQPNNFKFDDINNDGILDLFTMGTPNNISVSIGNGDGTFKQALTINTVGNTYFGYALGDFNKDGLIDLATNNLDQSTVSIYLRKP